MTKVIYTLSLLFLFQVTSAQEVIRAQPCSDTSMKKQADSLLQLYTSHGYELLREASMKMESEYEMPVIVPLQERSLYQIVFIGDMKSKLYEVRMYDYDEKQVFYKKLKPELDGNIISYGYMPKISEWHMIKPVQVNKKKKILCGYVMLLKKTK